MILGFLRSMFGISDGIKEFLKYISSYVMGFYIYIFLFCILADLIIICINLFKFKIENKLPIQIIPQLYMLSENEVIDSLFTNTLIHACFDNEPVEDILEISVVDEKIENVI